MAENPPRRELLAIVKNGSDRAAVDEVGFRLMRAFRLFTAERVWAPLNAWLRRHAENADYSVIRQSEGPLWELLQTRPEHWLNPNFDSWRALLLASADAVMAELTADGAALNRQTWGDYNTLAMQHPLSLAVPYLGWLLDMPATPLPGGTYMPRVQTPTAGASQRMAVAPGREEQGIFHMPGGQSGHPLSPYYRAGHQDWVDGVASPLLPGSTRHRLRLLPQKDFETNS